MLAALHCCRELGVIVRFYIWIATVSLIFPISLIYAADECDKGLTALSVGFQNNPARSERLKIVIVGGTGFIGPHVVRKLLTLGHEVTLFNRGSTSPTPPEGVTQLKGRRQDLATFREEFARISPDVVIDMIPFTESDAETLSETFDGIARRCVIISSQDVYRAFGILVKREEGPPEPSPITESAALRTNLFLYRTEYEKILIERRMLQNAHLQSIILRLPSVYGPGDRQHRLYRFLKPMLDGRPAIVLAEDYANWHDTYGYVENVADAVVAASCQDCSGHQIFNVGEQPVTTYEWVDAIKKSVGWNGNIVGVPRDRLPTVLHPSENTEQDFAVDTSSIRSRLGYSETVSLEEALARAIVWEKTGPNKPRWPWDIIYSLEDAALQAP